MKSKTKRIYIILAKIAGGLLLLSIALHTVMVAVTASAVRKSKEALKATGYPMTAAEVIPKPLPDEQNAAVEVMNVFRLMTQKGTEVYIPGISSGKLEANFKQITEECESNSFQTPFTNEKLEILEKAFAIPEVEQAFVLLSLAADKPGLNFNLAYEKGPKMAVPEVRLYANLYRLLAVRAKYESQKGNKNRALQHIQESLVIGNFLKNEPNLICQLIRNVGVNLSLPALLFSSAHNEFTAEEIQSTLLLLKPYTDLKPMQLGLHGERILYGTWFFEFDEYLDMENLHEHDFSGVAYLEHYDWYVFRPIFNADYASYLNFMRVNSECMEMDLKTALEVDTKKLAMDEIGKFAILSEQFAAYLSGMRIREASRIAMSHMTEIAVACNQFRLKNGVYPDSLQNIGPFPVDEATGEPFGFKKTADGVLIYSTCDAFKGANNESIDILVDGEKKQVFGIQLIAPQTN